ncbi:dihydropteroate synthase, partial [Pseudoalteromonas sp. S326]|uniref:dihydropteroate synthase n=1 Tax=Pseudoalteromonas sp. S326 TaxID=579533 RepID=UPI00126EEAAA
NLADELNRVIPAIKAIRAKRDCVRSVETSKAQVMEQASLAAADIVNAVRAIQHPHARSTRAKYPDVAICVMHMQGQPRTMQSETTYTELPAQ